MALILPWNLHIDALIVATCHRGSHAGLTGFSRSLTVAGVPTIHREGPYRFFFYAADRDEPPHVHVERENRTAKFWLTPVRLERSAGFSRGELSRIRRLVTANQASFMRGWSEYFTD